MYFKEQENALELLCMFITGVKRTCFYSIISDMNIKSKNNTIKLMDAKLVFFSDFKFVKKEAN